MITSHDIERARRAYVAAIGTPDESRAKADLLTLIAQAKREHGTRRMGAS